MNYKELFTETQSLQAHIDAQTNNYSEYMAHYILLRFEYNIEFTNIRLAKILVAAFIRKDKQLIEYLLKDELYEPPIICKVCEILDSERLIKQLEKKLEKYPNIKSKGKLTTVISNLKQLNETVPMKLTSSKVFLLKEYWIKNISKERLEYMALLYPTKLWKSIINMFHCKPNDFQLDWFTSYIFTNNAPENSIIDICSKINNTNLKSILEKYKLPYDFLRLKYKNLLNETILKYIAEYTSIDNILRHWDVFGNIGITDQLEDRLNNEELLMPYGELLKRLQNLKNSQVENILIKIAEDKLNNYNLSVKQPVVVLGDASASMQVAINTSSIITSILTKICSAKMHLFRECDQPIINTPKSVEDVLAQINQYKAYNCTAPAASLYPYYYNKEVVETFIIITDEEENYGYCNMANPEYFFAPLFKKYREEVHQAKLVFISFLPDNSDGFMVRDLKNRIPGIEKDIIRFVMNNKNPDLRKLDNLLNTLEINNSFYDIQLDILKKHTCNNILFDKITCSKLLSDNSNFIIEITI